MGEGGRGLFHHPALFITDTTTTLATTTTTTTAISLLRQTKRPNRVIISAWGSHPSRSPAMIINSTKNVLEIIVAAFRD